MNTSDELNEIAKALSNMQGSMGAAKKDKVNPFFKSSYADLTSVWNAIREPLNENGLCVTQDAVTLNIGISVSTRLIHESGQWMEFGPLVVPLTKQDAQAVGSAISYAKRYALGACLGVVAEVDDDGNKATKAAKKEAKEEPKIEPFTEEQIDEWVDFWSLRYDIGDLQEYCSVRAKHFGHSVNVTVAELDVMSASKVSYNIDTWLAKRDLAQKKRQEEIDASSEEE